MKRTATMVFNTIRTRLTRTSSDLRTLSAALLPPSPILKADDLLPRSTSGEIPILFEATTHVCEALACPRKPPGLWQLGDEIIDMADTTAHTMNVNNGDEGLLENWMAMESNERCISAELPIGRHPGSPSGSFLAWAIACKLKNASRRTYHDFSGGDSGHPNTQDDFPLQMLEKRDAFDGLQDSQASYLNTTAFSSIPVVPKEDLDADQLPIVATFHTYSKLPTPAFAPPSPSPSTDVISPSSSPTGRQRHRRPLERARAVRLPGRPRSPRLQGTDTEAHSPTKQTYRRQPADTTPMASTSSCTTDVMHPLLKHVALPDELSWLQHLAIELWFDQEGFRAARPCMQLIGYSPRTRSLYPYEPARDVESDITAGVAEFMPTKRETFPYHYSTLDSPPTLRMISIAGDESRDYISRQATLSVKLNGVYTVLGTETSTASILTNDTHGLRLHNVRLRWKFDYLVSDRKVDGTGKTLPGEKTLTPLTFSCSPYLFHPLQGKKAGLMHIVKKNLVPKLGSRKVEPPPYSPTRAILPRAPQRLPSARRDIATHARCHSDALTKGGQYLLARSPLLEVGVGRGAIPMEREQRARRRRASSAGESSLICLRDDSPTGYPGIDPAHHA